MSRLSSRVCTAIAAPAIVLLVVFLVILRSGMKSSNTMGTISVYRVMNTSELRHNSYQDQRQIVSPETVTFTAEINYTSGINDVSTNVYTWSKNHSIWKDNDVSNVENNTEYVKLLKISQNQYEDPPSEVNNAKRHHSGHFRHSNAEIWDPHPQYKFTAFGIKFLLKLAYDNSFISQDIKVTHTTQNTTKWEHPGHQLGCYYSGIVDGDPNSAVSVSLCHGMTGHMKTSTGTYMIEPADNWKMIEDNSADESTLQHTIHRVSSTPTNTNNVDLPSDVGHNCGVIDHDLVEEAPLPLIDNSSAAEVYVGNHMRKRRSLTEKLYHDESIEDDDSPWQYRYGENVDNDDSNKSDFFKTWRPRRALPREYFIEIMVVADAKMVEYHGDRLVAYIFVLMNTVSRIFKDPSIGNPISIAVTRIIQSDKTFGVKHLKIGGINASEMLNNFCHWQARMNPDEPSPKHYDAAFLLTREKLCHNPVEERCDTLGLAELGQMCRPGSSCAIAQDTGLAVAFTIAHELGHVFNMPHDDDRKCAKFQNKSEGYNLMYRTLSTEAAPWVWSKCSRHYLTEFLDGGYANCLLDQPMDIIKSSDARLPGEYYSIGEQCEFVFGSGFEPCLDKNYVCKKLWCANKNDSTCRTNHTPWADGTPCSDGYWCRRGECVPKRNLTPSDGQWGEWGHYGECSRTCGGGIKTKYRECNNPPPLNGGNYCVGERVKYRSCGTKECPVGSPDFREEQCSMFNNKNLNIKDVARDVKWHAKYVKTPPENVCRLYCQVDSNQYYMLREKVIDGTPCGPDTFDICVNGQCKPAGCDHVLNSTAELDICGVCRGDNSTCQRISDVYNSTSVHGYRRVAKIPAGSIYIDIRQHAWGGAKKDNNYLALRSGEHGEYILNGNFIIMPKKIIVLPGITIEYSGPESIVERLNSSRPINVDLILEVISASDYTPPQITYEYTVPKKILDSYTWILSDWSGCSNTCQGTKQRRAECRNKKHKDVVPDDYCRPEERPQEQNQLCNTHCMLQWDVISVSECSNHCGSGTRTVTSRCVQILLDSIDAHQFPHPLPDHVCAHLERPYDIESCMGPCDDAYWSYTEWGACSVTCGGGTQIRAAKCIDSNGRSVSENKCNASEKILEKFCSLDACPQWTPDKWSPCSVTCGIGIQSRSYWCRVENRIKSASHCGNSILPEKKMCNAGPCPRWSTGEWTSCSVTCGEGTRRRKVACSNANDTTDNSCATSIKPDSSEKCVMDPCPTVENKLPSIYSSNPPQDESSEQENEIDSNDIRTYVWRTGTFGKCSRSCDGGIMKRIVQCTSPILRITAPDDYCDSGSRPMSTSTCNEHSCPLWHTSDWTQCAAGCGVGLQRRQVRCQSSKGEELPEEACNAIRRPEHTKRCWKIHCVTSRINNPSSKSVNFHKWRTSNWTPCSKSCGGGIKSRLVECRFKTRNTEQVVDDIRCTRLGINKPRSQRPCQRIPCNYAWQEGSWSECSTDCGEGFQQRNVTCHRVNQFGWIDPAPSDGCPISEKPKHEQKCKLRECDDEFYWTTGAWRKCSHQCGRKGRQMRRLFCHDSSGKRVARVNCPEELKPQRKRKCNQRRCGPLTCLEAQKRFKSTKDGDYVLLIGGRNMTIYCHDMATSEPKEYLTLPEGERENYAEIYDRRLKDPNTCPFNGERNDNFDGAYEFRNTSGRTMFRRVRIDVARLIIKANDYTFSWTKGTKRVEYGKAGDCYSFKDCPQGRFSINLNGTSLKLVRQVTWKRQTAQTFLAINRVSDQRILGKCGGYCGFCIPNMDLKLDVLPL